MNFIFLPVTSLINAASYKSVSALSDEHIIDKVLKGEKNLYNLLIERHKNYAYTIALNMVAVKEDAEEIAHDSFIKAFKNLNKFNREAKFSTWLYRIVFNTAISFKRKTKIEKQDLESAYKLASGNADALEAKDQKKYIRIALAQLSEDDSLMITLFYLKEFSLEEIAEITKISVNTIKVKLHRARRRMADMLKKLLKEEAVTL